METRGRKRATNARTEHVAIYLTADERVKLEGFFRGGPLGVKLREYIFDHIELDSREEGLYPINFRNAVQTVSEEKQNETSVFSELESICDSFPGWNVTCEFHSTPDSEQIVIIIINGKQSATYNTTTRLVSVEEDPANVVRFNQYMQLLEMTYAADPKVHLVKNL